MKIRNLIVALAITGMIAIPAVAQDDCSSAVVAIDNGAAATVDPCNSVNSSGDIGSCATGGGVLVTWAKFVATDTTARIRSDIGSLGSDSDYGVYSSSDNTCGGTMTEIGCSEDDAVPTAAACCNGDISVEGLTIGDTYFLKVGSWGDGCPETDPFTYDITVTSPIVGNICGDGIRSPVAGDEECDGADADACNAILGCAVDCTCELGICGDNVAFNGEECDGTDNSACILGCLGDCTCDPVGTPALPTLGKVALALLLFAGAFFAFGRRREVTA